MQNDITRRARAYLAKIPPAIEREGGHTATFMAAQHMVRGFELTGEQAFTLLKEWNTRCIPRWPELDLRRKISEAFNKGTMPLGLHLGSNFRLARPTNSPESLALPFPELTQSKSWLRDQWPPFTLLTCDGVKRVAALRGITDADVYLADPLLGSPLRLSVVDGHPVVVFHQDQFAQVRRLDGQLLNSSNGPIKAKNLPGSEGAFVGMRHPLSQFRVVFLIEGVFGLLDFFAAFRLVGYPPGVAVVAATSGNSRFKRQPAWLPRFAGANIRILPDNDSVGNSGAQSWHDDLSLVARSVGIWPLPSHVKDLGDLVKNPSPTNIRNLTTLLTL